MEFNYENMKKLANEKKEFRIKTEMVNGVEIDIFSYMVNLKDTFDSELAKEFRGTCFTKDGVCISRPLPKFFNLGEREETQAENFDFDRCRFYTKHDGSMATPVLINGKVCWKTKNSFFSDVAINIQKFYDKMEHSDWKRRMLVDLKYFTPIFEYVGPDNRIVLDYKDEELIYIGFRCLDTGLYQANDNLREFVSYDEIFDMNGIEGFVVEHSGTLFKMKTQFYLERHRIVTDFSPKNIINATLNEEIDDILGVVYQLGMPERAVEIEEVRDETLTKKLEIIEAIDAKWSLMCIWEDDRKKFALKVIEMVETNYRAFMFLKLDNKSLEDKINKLTYEMVYLSYKPTEAE
jgi:RNA ligase